LLIYGLLEEHVIPNVTRIFAAANNPMVLENDQKIVQNGENANNDEQNDNLKKSSKKDEIN